MRPRGGLPVGAGEGDCPATGGDRPGAAADRGGEDRASAAAAVEATSWRDIPITTVPRTLVDLAADLDEDDLARACHEAGVRYRTTPRQVEAVLARRANESRGAATLRKVLLGDVHVTLSKLEQRFLALLREAGLPLPITNRPAAAGGSTAAGPSTGSRSSSTATPSTTVATRGSRTGAASARPGREATSSAATATTTSSSGPASVLAGAAPAAHRRVTAAPRRQALRSAP